ncbi:hypothetical protein ACJ65_01585 [Kocuria rhizophila]|nr:hypothetical protein ACJ65_01585 [Kocuria rhizophila]
MVQVGEQCGQVRFVGAPRAEFRQVIRVQRGIPAGAQSEDALDDVVDALLGVVLAVADHDLGDVFGLNEITIQPLVQE